MLFRRCFELRKSQERRFSFFFFSFAEKFTSVNKSGRRKTCDATSFMNGPGLTIYGTEDTVGSCFFVKTAVLLRRVMNGPVTTEPYNFQRLRFTKTRCYLDTNKRKIVRFCWTRLRRRNCSRLLLVQLNERTVNRE